MSKEIRLVVFPEDGDLESAFIRARTEIRPIAFAAYALSSKSELARRLGNYGESANHALEAMRLSSRVTQDADMHTVLFSSIVMEGIAAEKLFAALSHLSARECHDVIAALQTIERDREPLVDAELRDRIREENIHGWHGKLLTVLTDFTNYYAQRYRLSRLREPQHRAMNRLLTLQLALRAYLLERGSLPDVLPQLVPHVLQQLPSDPFNPNGETFRYQRTGLSYLAYSFGADGDDDDGRAPARDPAGWLDHFGDGDLRLDIIFERQATPPANKAASKARDTSTAKSDN
jgi:hypothetical protein